MKADDLTGMKFGRLKVIEPAAPKIDPRGRQYTAWRCRCDCGRERVVRSIYLKRGQTTYCGQCKPPEWLGAKNRICRFCEYSKLNEERQDWDCTKGRDATIVKNKCDAYWCSPKDKLLGTDNNRSVCFVCGKTVYGHGRDVPLYCEEHRAHAKHDDEVFNKAPKELLFSLVAGIFLRAREDYLTNTEGQRSDAAVFLKGQWAQSLSVDGYDADALMRLLDEELYDGFEISER